MSCSEVRSSAARHVVTLDQVDARRLQRMAGGNAGGVRIRRRPRQSSEVVRTDHDEALSKVLLVQFIAFVGIVRLRMHL